ncbi:MAG TPA: alpha/beta fold hydrolase [Actinophytocola sp.]|uniref:alpha/beta fold hydrolase n=1 Tax=Actinophytocola sp. TaxID=1872138 RepID=UPI002DDD8508|nr:alpha/beta fold hydrolase [Actinophytocola sp.]HEV2781098.1 alpha/beta fold hydrolase [Actinophytocola sp.]
MNKTTSKDGTTIAFDRIGDGPPVILVEGAFCDRRTSAPLAARLADRFTVFSYDRRGKGDSGDTQPWSIERELEDLDAIIAAAGGSACAYGMSSGAVLILEAAARGLGMEKLALYEPPASREHSGDMVTRLSALVSAGRRGDAVEHFLTHGPQIPAEVIAQMKTSPMWAGLEAIAHTLVYDNTIATDPTVLDRAASVAVPTLVLGGADSPVFLRDAVRSVAEAVPGARHRYLAGQTHQVDPAVLAVALAEFFA